MGWEKFSIAKTVNMKIQIIGYSGSGKSTLATRLGEIAGIDVLHLDSTHFYGNWQERTDEEQTAIVRQFLATHESWVLDGNWRRIAPERYQMTDITILLMLNRWTCFRAAYKRYRKYRDVSRPDLGCPEKFDKSFRRWVFWEGRKKSRKQTLYEGLNATSGQKVVLKTRRQVEKFVKDFSERFGK